MSSSTLALPAPDRGWILYSGGSETARGEDLRALAGKRGDLVVGIPAASVSTFVVDLPPAGTDLHESMIRAQVDKRGLSARGGALIDYERIAGGERGDTFAVRVVPELPADCLVTTAAGYHLSASLRNPGGTKPSATVWREHGRLVLGVAIGGSVVHVQVLSGKPEVGKALASEINLVFLGLRGESVFEESAPGEVILSLEGVGEPEWIEFRSAMSLPVRCERPVIPARVAARDRLLPPEVTRQRGRRRAAVRNLALGAIGLVIYTVVGVWVWKDAQVTKREIASLERRLSIIQPDVERVQLVEERWRSLEPAFEKDLFPVVQLSRITSALPGSGVVVREYRTNGRNLRIRGQARDVQLANRLLEDLKGMAEFGRYDWSMPNPRVERNNTATFEIEGKLKNEGADS
jgi:Tfp pilus assembly protein PilN